MSQNVVDDASAQPDSDEPWVGSDDDLRAPKWFMAIGGSIALLAAAILTIDKIRLLEAKAEGENLALGCDISAWVSCGGVMQSAQASAFGFPNSVIGVIGFSVVVTLGVLLLAGVTLPRWIWGGLQVGVLFGIGFVTWLQVQSIYKIELLCPWCMVVWAVMIPLFVLVTAHNLRMVAPNSAMTRFVSNWNILIIALWYIAIVAAIWFAFGPDRLFS